MLGIPHFIRRWRGIATDQDAGTSIDAPLDLRVGPHGTVLRFHCSDDRFLRLKMTACRRFADDVKAERFVGI